MKEVAEKKVSLDDMMRLLETASRQVFHRLPICEVIRVPHRSDRCYLCLANTTDGGESRMEICVEFQLDELSALHGAESWLDHLYEKVDDFVLSLVPGLTKRQYTGLA